MCEYCPGRTADEARRFYASLGCDLRTIFGMKGIMPLRGYDAMNPLRQLLTRLQLELEHGVYDDYNPKFVAELRGLVAGAKVGKAMLKEHNDGYDPDKPLDLEMQLINLRDKYGMTKTDEEVGRMLMAAATEHAAAVRANATIDVIVAGAVTLEAAEGDVLAGEGDMVGDELPDDGDEVAEASELVDA